MALFCIISANSGSFRAHCVKVHVRYLIYWWVLVLLYFDGIDFLSVRLWLCRHYTVAQCGLTRAELWVKVAWASAMLQLSKDLYDMLESWCRGSSAASIRSPVVDWERTRPGHWFRSVLFAAFSALTLLVGWQQGHPAHENNLCCVSSIVLFQKWRKKTVGNWLMQAYRKCCC